MIILESQAPTLRASLWSIASPRKNANEPPKHPPKDTRGIVERKLGDRTESGLSASKAGEAQVGEWQKPEVYRGVGQRTRRSGVQNE